MTVQQELRKLVFPVLTMNQDGSHTCIGTGFLIVAAGRQALLVTAAHVIKRMREIAQPASEASRHDTGLLFASDLRS